VAAPEPAPAVERAEAPPAPPAAPPAAPASVEQPAAPEPTIAEPVQAEKVAAPADTVAASPPSTEGQPEQAAETVAAGPTRTSLVISGVPGFSRALALQRSIGQLPGVTEAKAIGYERGVLGLEVQHDGSLNLAERVTTLPGIRLTITESAPGQLQLSAE
jgi:hypothetical protein